MKHYALLSFRFSYFQTAPNCKSLPPRTAQENDVRKEVIDAQALQETAAAGLRRKLHIRCSWRWKADIRFCLLRDRCLFVWFAYVLRSIAHVARALASGETRPGRCKAPNGSSETSLGGSGRRAPKAPGAADGPASPI